MSFFICIETATPVCSVALSQDDKIIGIKISEEHNSHSKVVTQFIQDLLIENNLKPSHLSAVSVSKGPGSYTGLRIGVSTAKGLCYALSIPLISINTLHSMALGMIEKSNLSNSPEVLFCPMIDARRMEVYSALYNSKGIEVRETKAEIIEENSFSDVLGKKQIIFFGDGAGKCKKTITHKNATFIDDFSSSAQYMLTEVFRKYNNEIFEDVAYFEPFYLKDFVAGIPKVKGLK